jgi:DNA primase
MLTPDSVERIKQAARIEEVVGDFVTLKRRGSNLIGRCPFHDEKTPSFTVNPARNIFKCFGCGKAGDSAKFVMEHEHFSFPESLKYLARKYSIEIEEREITPEEKQAETERESLFAANEFARNYFRQTLTETEEGQSVGMSYFKERGFSAEIIEKFQLGYSPESFDAFLNASAEKGYKEEYLIKLGLIKENEKGRKYDAYRGRVIFPIHNISGRVIGFGGRVLKKTETAPKYINSPQNEIYDKSKTLYGIYFAKDSIIKNDLCYLVEGYTDVISLYQAGIRNAVASSGTSLTGEQIKLIRRFTENVTILYDGDPAGIKASFRGIDMILEQGLNVRVLLFPEGEDPDSFASKNTEDALAEYLKTQVRDFIGFKTDVLVKDAGDDPVKRAQIVRDVVNSISLIPDPIKRSVFLRESARIFAMEEAMLTAELNKILRNRRRKASEEGEFGEPEPDADLHVQQMKAEAEAAEKQAHLLPEEDLIRLLLLFGTHRTHVVFNDANGQTYEADTRVADILIPELREEAIPFSREVHNRILARLETLNLTLHEEDGSFDEWLLREDDEEIKDTVIHLISTPHRTSDRWTEKNPYVPKESDNLYHKLNITLNSFKLSRLERFLKESMERLKSAAPEETDGILQEIKIWEDVRREISQLLGRVILK